MIRGSRLFVRSALGLFTILAVFLSGCSSAPGAIPTLGDWEKTARFYAEAQSDAAGPFLAMDPGASGSEKYAPASHGLTSGASSSLERVQGRNVASIDFPLAALPASYYLNLSKPVIGVVYWSSAVTADAEATDGAHIRAELRAGNKRVGGDEYVYAAGLSGDAAKWQRLPLLFRSETALLAKGESLTLKVWRLDSTADFIVGTGGDHQSFVEFHYFDSDPLMGALYLEKGRLVTAPASGGGQESTQEFLDRAHEFASTPSFTKAPEGLVMLPPLPTASNDSNAGAAAFAGLGLFALGIARVGDRKNRLAILLVLLVALGGLSGCVGGGKTAQTTSDGPAQQTESTIEASLVPDKEVVKGKGSVKGLVREADTGLPIPAAHLSFLGTSLFTTSAKNGSFSFVNVTAGEYTLSVDAQNYLSAESQVPVEEGSITTLNVTLTRPLDVTRNQKVHVHDNWNGQTQKLLLEDRVTPLSVGNQKQEGQYTCVANWYACAGLVTLPPDVVVLPGTSLVEVVLDWEQASDAPKEASLAVTTAGNRSTADIEYVARGPGEPFYIAVFPNEADPGHQMFSSWIFEVRLHAKTSLYHSTSVTPIQKGTDIGIKITAFKGVVPYEPAHRDMWAGKSEIPIVTDEVGHKISCVACNFPNNGAVAYYWDLDKGAFVPPGTKEIRGTFSYKGPANGPSVIDWSLVYIGANVPPAQWEAHYEPVPMTKSGSSGEVVLPVDPNKADQFYQTTSYWRFWIDDNMPGVAGWGCSCSYDNTVALTLTAYRDPAWKDV